MPPKWLVGAPADRLLRAWNHTDISTLAFTSVLINSSYGLPVALISCSL